MGDVRMVRRNWLAEITQITIHHPLSLCLCARTEIPESARDAASSYFVVNRMCFMDTKEYISFEPQSTRELLRTMFNVEILD